MGKKVVWTESAWTDLETVADFIARDSPYYAASFVREIHNHAHSLSRMSARGRVVPEIGDRQIRELFVQSYRLIYKVEPIASGHSRARPRSQRLRSALEKKTKLIGHRGTGSGLRDIPGSDQGNGNIRSHKKHRLRAFK